MYISIRNIPNTEAMRKRFRGLCPYAPRVRLRGRGVPEGMKWDDWRIAYGTPLHCAPKLTAYYTSEGAYSNEKGRVAAEFTGRWINAKPVIRYI